MSKPAHPLIGWNNAGTTSNLYKMDGNQLVGFILPANTASTSVTFTMASSLSTAANSIFIPVADSSGSAISFTVTASTAKYYGFSQDQIAKFTGIEIIKMVMGSSEAVGFAAQLIIIPRQY